MGNIRLDVPVNASPIPAALDAFYDFAVSIIPPGPDDKVAILGTIVEFDITEKSPLYNDFVVRAFSDRTVRVSPVPGQAAGDISDRYSSRYIDMVEALVLSLDAELTPAQNAQIETQQTAIDVISADRDTYLDTVEVAWTAEASRLGIDADKIDDDAVRQRYIDERLKFLTTRRYAQRIWGENGFNTRIRQREIKIASIRRQALPDDDYLQLYRLYEARLDLRVIRPRSPDLEISRHWDSLSIQDPQNFGMGAVLDIAVHTSSIVDPRVILKGLGKRGYSVSQSTITTNSHDSAWNVSGSASYMSFFSGSVNSESQEHYRSTISRIRNITVEFAHVGELQLYRDAWFASTLLTDNKRVVDYLKDKPALSAKLNLLTTGLAIGRGLTLTLEFTDTADVHEWGSSSASGGGGVNICGYQLGGKGGKSSSYDRQKIDIDKKTITFTDDPAVCRIIGLRTTPLSSVISSMACLTEARPIWDIPTLQQALMSTMQEGELVDIATTLTNLNSNLTSSA